MCNAGTLHFNSICWMWGDCFSIANLCADDSRSECRLASLKQCAHEPIQLTRTTSNTFLICGLFTFTGHIRITSQDQRSCYITCRWTTFVQLGKGGRYAGWSINTGSNFALSGDGTSSVSPIQTFPVTVWRTGRLQYGNQLKSSISHQAAESAKTNYIHNYGDVGTLLYLFKWQRR